MWEDGYGGICVGTADLIDWDELKEDLSPEFMEKTKDRQENREKKNTHIKRLRELGI